MALKGIESTKAALRATRLVYWRIFEDSRTKTAGSFLASANFEDPDLTETQSYEDLSAALDRLTSGRYILLAYKTNTSKGGAAFESAFEISPDYRSSSIGSVTPEFIMEGIGKVTPENFEAAIEKKMKMMLDKQAEEKRLADLQAENERLKKELKENDGTINKGLLAIGAVLYPMMSKTPAFKEVFSMVSGVMKQLPSDVRPQELGTTAAPAAATPAAEHIEGDTCEIGGIAVAQDELFATLDELGSNNPDVLQHLKVLAGLKKNNPDMYNQAVEMAKDL